MLRFLYHLTIFVCLGVQCDAGQDPRFVMTPSMNDNFLLLGDPLDLNCTIETIEPALYSVHNLSFKENAGPLPQHYNLVYHDQDLTLQLYIPSVSLQDLGKPISYACYYNGEFKAFKMVRVGVPPVVPTNITCVLNNFVKMVCYFTTSPVDTYIPIKWTMFYRTNSGSEVNKTCNEVTDPSASLSCDGPDDKDIVKGEWYSINITGVNLEYDFYIQTSFEVYTDQTIVKPDKVADLHYDKIDRGLAVNLTWKFPPHLDSNINLMYKLHIDGQLGWDTRTLMYTPTDKPQDVSYVLDGLVPFCNYTVTVSCKLVTTQGSMYWSDPVSVHFQTSQDIPERSTTLDRGSYLAVDDDSGDDTYIPVLYWKNPDVRYSHGPITGYQITISNYKKKPLVPVLSSQNPSVQEADGVTVPHIQVENVTGYRVWVKLNLELERTEEYLVEMKTATDVGYSNAVSSLKIHKLRQTAMIKPHRVIVELDADNNRALVSWQLQNGTCDGPLNVTYFWCQPAIASNSSFVNCEGLFDWMTVPFADNCSNGSQQWVDLPGTSVKFAVSLTTDDSLSGGLLWESCRFDYTAVPDMPLFRVDANPLNKTRLLVTIMYDACYSSDGGRPHVYRVFYEKSSLLESTFQCNQAKNVSVFRVNFDNPILELTGLAETTNYTVCVQAGNDAGLGHYGKAQAAVTLTDQSSVDDRNWINGWLWLIILSVTLGSVLLSIAAYYVRKRYKQIIKPVDIHVPVMPEYVKRQNPVDQYHIEVCETEITASQNETLRDKDSGQGSSQDGQEAEHIPMLPPRTSLVSNAPSSQIRKVSSEHSGYEALPDIAVTSVLGSSSSLNSSGDGSHTDIAGNCVLPDSTIEDDYDTHVADWVNDGFETIGLDNVAEAGLTSGNVDGSTSEGDIPNISNTDYAGHGLIGTDLQLQDNVPNKPNRDLLQGNNSTFKDTCQRNSPNTAAALQCNILNKEEPIVQNSITKENFTSLDKNDDISHEDMLTSELDNCQPIDSTNTQLDNCQPIDSTNTQLDNCQPIDSTNTQLDNCQPIDSTNTQLTSPVPTLDIVNSGSYSSLDNFMLCEDSGGMSFDVEAVEETGEDIKANAITSTVVDEDAAIQAEEKGTDKQIEPPTHRLDKYPVKGIVLEESTSIINLTQPTQETSGSTGEISSYIIANQVGE